MTHERATHFTFANGRKVNRNGYGAMRLTGQPGNFGPYEKWDEGIALLRGARELGINHIDTARAYGPHENERLIAEALRDSAGSYGDMFIASKGGVEKTAAGISRDTRPQTLKRHIDESLANLGVERIDLYYLHAPDGRTSISESVNALDKARQEGKIDLIGISNVTRSEIEDAMKIAPIAAVQNRYSPGDASNDELEATIDWLNDLGVAFVPHGPLGANPMKQGATLEPTTALNQLLARSPNILVIPGTTSIAHLESNAAVLNA